MSSVDPKRPFGPDPTVVPAASKVAHILVPQPVGQVYRDTGDAPTPDFEALKPSPTPSGGPTFFHRIMGAFRRHDPRIAIVVLGSLVPVLIGATLPAHAETAKTEIVATSEVLPWPTVVADTVALPGGGIIADPYRAYIDSVERGMAAYGLPRGAPGQTIWLIASDPNRRALAQVAIDGEHGMARGAVVQGPEVPVYFSEAHRSFAGSVSFGLQGISAGHAPPPSLLGELVAVALFEQASGVRAIPGRPDGRTQVAVIASSTSPRSIATFLVDRLEAAPVGSAAATWLARLGSNRSERIEALAKSVAQTSRSNVVQSAVNALDRQLEEARSRGIVVFKAAGDDSWFKDRAPELSRDFADGLLGAVVVGSGTVDPRSGRVLPSVTSSQAWSSFTAPGMASGIGDDGQPSGAAYAATYAASLAVRLLEANPTLSANQLELLLSRTAALIDDRPSVIDARGVIDPIAVAKLANDVRLGQIELPERQGRFLFEKSLVGGKVIDPSHPYVEHIANIRRGLEERGLPTRADGVPVIIYTGGWTPHNGMVSRVVADPLVGLAPGADVSLQLSVPYYNDENRLAEARSNIDYKSITAGSAATKQFVINRAIGALYYRTAAVRDAYRRAAPDRTTLVNMSFGVPTTYMATSLIQQLESAAPGTPARKQLASFGNSNEERWKSAVQWIATVLEDPETQRALATAKTALADEVAKARQHRVLIFCSAGNDHKEWMTRPSESANIGWDVPGLLWIGATSIGDPKRFDDDKSTWFSASGRPTFAAPGEAMPVGPSGDVDGTSFSSPYGLSTAALMLKANPDLWPDQLEAMLTHAGVVYNLPGDRDGAGVINPIEAVALAAEAKGSPPVLATNLP